MKLFKRKKKMATKRTSEERLLAHIAATTRSAEREVRDRSNINICVNVERNRRSAL